MPPKPSDEKDFFKKAKKIVTDIRKAAKGRRCGDCRYYRGHYCGYEYKDWDKETAIETPDAVACPKWEAKEEPQK